MAGSQHRTASITHEMGSGENVLLGTTRDVYHAQDGLRRTHPAYNDTPLRSRARWGAIAIQEAATTEHTARRYIRIPQYTDPNGTGCLSAKVSDARILHAHEREELLVSLPRQMESYRMHPGNPTNSLREYSGHQIISNGVPNLLQDCILFNGDHIATMTGFFAHVGVPCEVHYITCSSQKSRSRGFARFSHLRASYSSKQKDRNALANTIRLTLNEYSTLHI